MQLFGKTKFLEDTKYLAHCTKSYVNLPGALLGGNLRESVAALQIHFEMSSCIGSGRLCATASLSQRAAAVQPTL